MSLSEAEKLASSMYKEHRFGDAPAWFDVSVRLAKQYLDLEELYNSRKTCNRHSDCRQAELEWAARNPEKVKQGLGYGFHCHSEDCEDCFGC